MVGTFIYFIKQVGVYTPRGVAPPARHKSHIVNTKIVNVIETTKQIPIYISQIVLNILLISLSPPIWGVYLFGIPPPPIKRGGPLPRIPPLSDIKSGVKRGVNPLNLVKSFLIEKFPCIPLKFFGKKSFKSEISPYT